MALQVESLRPLSMRDVLKIHASIERGGRDDGGKNQVGTIWEGMRLAKKIARQCSKISLQANEDMDKVKSRTLMKTAAIKAEVQSKILLVNKIDKGQRRPIESM